MTEASFENFKESGLITSFKEILDLKLTKLNEKWAKDFICDDSSVLNLIHKILDFQKKSF